MAAPRDISELREALRDAMGRERRDALLFSVLTVLLTPAFLAIAVLLALWALNDAEFSRIDPRVRPVPFLTGLNAGLVLLFASFFARPKAAWQVRASDLAWVGGATLALAAIFLLSYATPLAARNPEAFWILYGSLTLLLLALLGHAYVPKDHYYVRRGDWRITLDHEFEHAHFRLGFAVALPRLILGSYGDILGSFWLWRGLDGSGTELAARLLHALASGDPAATRGLLTRAPDRDLAPVLRWLSRMGLVSVDGRAPRLTSRGEKFTGTSAWF